MKFSIQFLKYLQIVTFSFLVFFRSKSSSEMAAAVISGYQLSIYFSILNEYMII
jgi:hypothetical protein